MANKLNAIARKVIVLKIIVSAIVEVDHVLLRVIAWNAKIKWDRLLSRRNGGNLFSKFRNGVELRIVMVMVILRKMCFLIDLCWALILI